MCAHRTRLHAIWLIAVIAGATTLLYGEIKPANAQVAIELSPGWNEIIWNGETAPVGNALSDVAGKFSAVFRWDNERQRWSSFKLSVPVSANTLNTLEKGSVYWIFTASGATLRFSERSQIGFTRDTPAPLGATLLLSTDWEITVLEVVPNAWPLIDAENRFNDPPDDGRVFFMVSIRASYRGSGSSRVSSSWLDVVGERAVAYSVGDCGVIPDRIHSGLTFTGGTIEGNLCWSILASDAPSLLMFSNPPFADDSARRWFGLSP